jgi:hypothetical protein
MKTKKFKEASETMKQIIYSKDCIKKIDEAINSHKEFEELKVNFKTNCFTTAKKVQLTIPCEESLKFMKFIRKIYKRKIKQLKQELQKLE